MLFLFTVFNGKKFRCADQARGCAQGLCASLVRAACALALCARGCAQLCAQRRIVVRGVVCKDCAQGCALGCAQVVCVIDSKSCAPQAAQGKCLFRKPLFERHNVHNPCAEFISLEFFSVKYSIFLCLI